MTPPRRTRPKVLNFEGHSVQLVAAWTLALAGLAHTPPSSASRTSTASTTLSSAANLHTREAPGMGVPLPRRARGPGVN